MKTYVTHLMISLLLSLSSIKAEATSFSLMSTGTEPVYQTTLSKEVYHYSRQDRLADLTIHNAAGEQVPYAILDYYALHPASIKSASLVPLKLFPITEQALANSKALSIRLNEGGNSQAVDVYMQEEARPKQHIYLVDAGKDHKPLQNLVVDWQGEDGTLLQIEVLASDNLNDWSSIGQGVVLKTSANGSTILQNTLQMDYSNQARYYQIQPKQRNAHFQLNSVNAQYEVISEHSPETLWQPLQFIQRTQEKGVIHLDFEALGHYPASFLNIQLPQQNTITQVQVLVRNHNNDPWQLISTASLYRLNKQGNVSQNPPLTISVSTKRYWRLQFNEASGGLGQENPTLSLGWLPDTVVWNARGNGPFQLIVGEPNPTSNRLNIESLIPDFNIEKVKQLPFASLTTNANLAPTANSWATTTDYKRWLLWAGLLLGVALLAGMAVSLLKTKN